MDIVKSAGVLHAHLVKILAECTEERPVVYLHSSEKAISLKFKIRGCFVHALEKFEGGSKPMESCISSLWKQLYYTLIEGYRRKIQRNGGHEAKLYYRALLLEAVGFYTFLLQKYAHHSTLELLGGVKPSPTITILPQPPALSNSDLSKIVVYLGDLYRYLNQAEKADDWSQVLGIYKHAAILNPSDGHCFNQSAIVSTLIGNDFHAFFYYCRGYVLTMMNTMADLIPCLLDTWQRYHLLHPKSI